MTRSLIHSVLFSIGMFMSSSISAQIGGPAPDFTAVDVHGKEHHLYEYLEAGKTVVLDFFFTTCIPCQFYTPQVNKAYEKYGCNTQDVVFISINFNDTKAEVIAYEEKYKIEFPSISGTEGGGNGIVSDYGIIGFPTFYVIDPDKTIKTRVDPPTVQVFDFEFSNLGIEPMECKSTSTTDHSNSLDLNITPNPIQNNQLLVQVKEGMTGLYLIEIYNAAGQMIKSTDVNISGSDVSVDVSELSEGVHFLKMTSTTDNTVGLEQFVK